jgi:uncharacterized membrane protein YfcA
MAFQRSEYPMEFLTVTLVALFASGLTLFSGFGLGTLLLPAFLLFFPADVAVAMTAIVHFLNNIFKLILLGRNASWSVVLSFGIPAMVAAFLGAEVLVKLAAGSPLFTYEFLGRTTVVLPVNLILAVLIICFAVLELLPSLQNVQFPRRYLPLGGVISGFFGGLSGHQGALRSAFLVRTGMTKEAFIASGVVISCMVDVTRLGVYAGHLASSGIEGNALLVAGVAASAFLGTVLGNRLVTRVTMKTIQTVVAALLIVIALGLGLGIL